VDTNFPLRLHVDLQNASSPCEQSYWFDDFGRYGWNITNDGCSAIDITEAPEYFWLNIGTVIAAIITLVALYYFIFWVHLKRQARRGSVTFQELQEPIVSYKNNIYLYLPR